MSIYLENLNASSCKYQLSVQDKLKKICAPIFEIGIKHFSYYVIFDNGETSSYFHVSTHKDYVIKHNTTIKRGSVREAVTKPNLSKKYSNIN
jgi:hypothetical protein